MRIAATVIITGRVQGVFFRAETRKTALSLGLSGWVRNLSDGSVKAFFQGDDTAVDKAMDWCAKGPPLSRVDRVDVSEETVRSGLAGFEIRY